MKRDLRADEGEGRLGSYLIPVPLRTAPPDRRALTQDDLTVWPLPPHRVPDGKSRVEAPRDGDLDVARLVFDLDPEMRGAVIAANPSVRHARGVAVRNMTGTNYVLDVLWKAGIDTRCLIVFRSTS